MADPTMMADPGLRDYAAVASALFAAAAAFASFVSTRQGKQLIGAAESPLLEVQVLQDPETDMLALPIINSGRGVARGAKFEVHALGCATDGLIGDGFLDPGDRVHVLTDIGPLPAPADKMRHEIADLAVMVAHRDARGFVKYRTHTGRSYVPRTRIRRRPR